MLLCLFYRSPFFFLKGNQQKAPNNTIYNMTMSLDSRRVKISTEKHLCRLLISGYLFSEQLNLNSIKIRKPNQTNKTRQKKWLMPCNCMSCISLLIKSRIAYWEKQRNPPTLATYIQLLFELSGKCPLTHRCALDS